MWRFQIGIKKPAILAIVALLILLTASLFMLMAASCELRTQTTLPNSPQPIPPQLQPSSTTPVTSSSAPQTYKAPGKNITVTMDDFNSLIFHVQGSVKTPGNVTAKYWSQETGPFFTAPVPTNGTTFSVEITRLRAATKYNLEVYLVEPSNALISQYQGSFTTGQLPPGLQNAKIQVTQGTPSYDLLLLDYDCTNFNGIVVIDGSGQIVWYYQNDNAVFTATQEDNHNIVFNELSVNVGYTMKEVSPDGRTVHSVNDILENGDLCAPNGRWSHEMLVRPGNKVWTIGAEIRSVNINGKDTLQTGGTIEEWDLNSGTVTRLVSMFDILDPIKDRGVESDTTTGFFWEGSQNQYANEAEDWTHTNSLDVLPNGDILVSNRHLDQIIAIKPDFSGIDWKLGGAGSDFTFPNPSDRFYHQHYVRMLPNGDLIIFDNGNTRPAAQGGDYSRALELKLDFKTMQATKVWEYRNKPDLYSSAVGSVVRLNNGNAVVDFGVDTLNDNPAIFTVVEADAKGNAVSVTKISSPGKTIQYRAIPINSLNGETKGSLPAH